jgi:hypothetical protein
MAQLGGLACSVRQSCSGDGILLRLAGVRCASCPGCACLTDVPLLSGHGAGLQLVSHVRVNALCVMRLLHVNQDSGSWGERRW